MVVLHNLESLIKPFINDGLKEGVVMHWASSHLLAQYF